MIVSVDMAEIEKRIKDSYELPNMVLDSVPAPLVSVQTITYQHGAFIRQCMDGVLMQRTSFPFEYVIGEDFSTDGTREIVLEYAKRHPNAIRVITADKNVGAKANVCRTLVACRGKYIALCEGDDYWTDPLKLQKQVDFLEAHPECSMCFHEAYDLWPDGRKVEYVRSHQKDIKPFYGLEDVVARHFIPTASMVFRNGLIDLSHPEFPQITAGDWMLHVMLAEKGALAFLDQNWSVRRIHPGGMMSMAAARISCQACDAQRQHHRSVFTRSIYAYAATSNHWYPGEPLYRNGVFRI